MTFEIPQGVITPEGGGYAGSLNAQRIAASGVNFGALIGANSQLLLSAKYSTKRANADGTGAVSVGDPIRYASTFGTAGWGPFTQTEEANHRPTFANDADGDPHFAFDGVLNEFSALKGGGSDLGNNSRIFMLLDIPADEPNGCLLANSPTAGGDFLGLFDGSTGTWWRRSNATGALVDGVSVGNQRVQLRDALIGAGVVVVELFNVDLGSQNDSAPWGQFAVGSWNSTSGSYHLLGKVYEVIVETSDITTERRTEILAYLQTIKPTTPYP